MHIFLILKNGKNLFKLFLLHILATLYYIKYN